MSDDKLKPGTRVRVTLADMAKLDDPTAVLEKDGVVVRHGRDASGVYTEIRLDDGAVERVHRSNPKPLPTFLELPAFSMIDPGAGRPHRHHIEAVQEWENEHGVKIEAKVVSNWPRTKWWASAIYPPRPNAPDTGWRASNTATTTSKAKAEQWIRDLAAGRVKIVGD